MNGGPEIDPLYVDVALRRWQAFTGKEATLAGDGRPFQQIAAERSNLDAQANDPEA